MSERPTPCVFRDDAFHPLPGFIKQAREAYGNGEVVNLVSVEDRSDKSHRHYFVAISETWKNLPDHLVAEFPTSEHLRKKALIKAGYRNERTLVCPSRAMAAKVAAFLRPLDEYAVISVVGTTVVELTAKSQSMKAMGKTAFQESKDAVLTILADLIDIEPQALLERAKEAA